MFLILKNIKNSYNNSEKKNAPPIKRNITNERKGNFKRKTFDFSSRSKTRLNSKNIIIVSKNKKAKKKEIKGLTKEKIKEILAYIDVELNELGYKKAFKLDHRTYWKYYFSLLKTKHIFFQIFNKKDYNSISIKILLLFFNFSANFEVNAYFIFQ